MIKIRVVTEMIFKDTIEFYQFLHSADVAKLTGFKNELVEAYQSKRVVEVVTPRPAIGQLTVSTVEVRER